FDVQRLLAGRSLVAGLRPAGPVDELVAGQGPARLLGDRVDLPGLDRSTAATSHGAGGDRRGSHGRALPGRPRTLRRARYGLAPPLLGLPLLGALLVVPLFVPALLPVLRVLRVGVGLLRVPGLLVALLLVAVGLLLGVLVLARLVLVLLGGIGVLLVLLV